MGKVGKSEQGNPSLLGKKFDSRSTEDFERVEKKKKESREVELQGKLLGRKE